MSIDHELLVSRGTSLQAPLSVSAFRKAPAPTTGDKFGTWGPDGMYYARLPGGSVLTFDLSKLTLQDFRQMRDDYQLSASLNVLTFLIAQADFSIDCENQKIADEIEEGIREYWFPLVRALSTAFWAGFAPIVKVWELNSQTQTYRITNYKDLIPEQSRVHWKVTRPQGPQGPSIYNYDGIDFGGEPTIPGANTIWYPILMENGNYYGRKLLRPAFPAWFFSQLMHLFTNRYFERFGEPTAVGYYPSDETVKDSGGHDISARSLMEQVLTGLRSRGVVSLPSETDEHGKPVWDIKFLESQMRGVDFDRYIARLDEEKSLALFTPVLLFRTGERGSYNLGTHHLTVFQWMLNALLMDMKFYLDQHLVKPLHDVNFGPNAPKAQFRFRTMGRIGDDGAISILQALIQNGGANLDEKGLADLGAYLGLGLQAVQQLTGSGPAPAGPPKPGGAPGAPGGTDPRLHPGQKSQKVSDVLSAGRGKPPSDSQTSAHTHLLSARKRLEDQIARTFASKSGADLESALASFKVGYKGAFVNAMESAGADQTAAEQFFAHFSEDVLGAIQGAQSPEDALAGLSHAYAAYGITDA